MWVATEIFKKWFHKKEELEDEEDKIELLKQGRILIFWSSICFTVGIDVNASLML